MDLPPKMSKQPKHLESPPLGSWGFSESQVPFQWGATFRPTSAQLSRGATVRATRVSGSDSSITRGTCYPTAAGIPWSMRQLRDPWDIHSLWHLA